jgi:hypothetical protein
LAGNLCEGKKTYKKDFSKMYILKKARLIDDACTVVFYESKTENKYEFYDVFTPHQLEGMNQESIMMKRIYDEAQKEKYINLYYNKTLVEVSKRILQKERLLLPAKKERFWKFYTAKSLDTFYPM